MEECLYNFFFSQCVMVFSKGAILDVVIFAAVLIAIKISRDKQRKLMIGTVSVIIFTLLTLTNGLTAFAHRPLGFSDILAGVFFGGMGIIMVMASFSLVVILKRMNSRQKE